MEDVTEISDEHAEFLRARIDEHTKGPDGRCKAKNCRDRICYSRAIDIGTLISSGRGWGAAPALA